MIDEWKDVAEAAFLLLEERIRLIEAEHPWIGVGYGFRHPTSIYPVAPELAA